jgi:hypothetical protein
MFASNSRSYSTAALVFFECRSGAFGTGGFGELRFLPELTMVRQKVSKWSQSHKNTLLLSSLLATSAPAGLGALADAGWRRRDGPVTSAPAGLGALVDAGWRRPCRRQYQYDCDNVGQAARWGSCLTPSKKVAC